MTWGRTFAQIHEDEARARAARELPELPCVLCGDPCRTRNQLCALCNGRVTQLAHAHRRKTDTSSLLARLRKKLRSLV